MRYHEIICESSAIEAVIHDPTFRQWFQGSQVVDADGMPLLCHHGTTAHVEVSKFRPFTHFGTIGAAQDRLMKKNTQRFPTGSSVIPVFLRIIKPLDIPDLDTHMTPDRMVIAADHRYNILGGDLKRLMRLPKWQFPQAAANALKERGIDGFRYENGVEEKGSISWVILSEDQVWTLFGGADLERIRADKARADTEWFSRVLANYKHVHGRAVPY